MTLSDAQRQALLERYRGLRVTDTYARGPLNEEIRWINRGAVGVVTNGGARDTDELIKQGVPVYSRKISRGIRPGRLELDATNVPVSVGGVYVRPGDVIVADGDGAICVPIERAEEVATLNA